MSCSDLEPYEGPTECAPVGKPKTLKLDIRRDGVAYDQLGNFIGKVERFGREIVLFTTNGNQVLTPSPAKRLN